ncbi:Polyphosphate synthetase [Schizosaccharomyces pombe]
MRFSDSIEAGIYEPWRDKYMNYPELKHLLKTEEEAPSWGENDESKFVSVMDAQLEKVYAFHLEILKELNESVDWVKSKVSASQEPDGPPISKEEAIKLLERLDSCTETVKKLEKYTRLNLTGFFKIVKKHDKLYPGYSLRPVFQVRLRACPLGSVQFNPLLAEIFSLYNTLRDGLSAPSNSVQVKPKHEHNVDYNSSMYRRRTFRFWVHPDNVMEVKTYIMRHLPVLYYSGKQGFDKDQNGVSGILDPISTCLYLDNSNFDLYSQNLERSEQAYSLRLHWYGKLTPKTDIIVERMVRQGSTLSHSEDRFTIREKKVRELLSGRYDFRKVEDDHSTTASDQKKKLIEDVEQLIVDNHLQPVLRSVYTRTAFQIPGDDEVRINLDSDWVMIREDSLDIERPCRDPEDWHRHDIDDADFPYKHLRKGEYSRFPYSVLEIRECVRYDEDEPLWISELRNSHLISEIDGFSKYEHGVAILFEKYVSLLPMWVFSMDQDIRKDLQEVYSHPEGSAGSRNVYIKRRNQRVLKQNMTPEPSQPSPLVNRLKANEMHPVSEEPEDNREYRNEHGDHFNFRSIPGLLKPSTYGSFKHHGKTFVTPPHIKKPEIPLRVSGPIKVEAKVWLANERTFLKWLHVVVLLGSLALALYNSAGERLGQAFGVVYTLLAIFIGFYAWKLHAKRSQMIKSRSPAPMTDYWGPLIVGTALAISLIVNMSFALKDAVYQNLIEPDHLLVKLFT